MFLWSVSPLFYVFFFKIQFFMLRTRIFKSWFIFPLLFITLIFIHLLLKCSELTITQRPLLMTYWPDLLIVTMFAQNLILLFQLCANGKSSIQYYGTLILNRIPDWIRDSETLDQFEGKIRKWNPINCPLHVTFAKKCIRNLGFINHIWFYIVASDLVDITKNI